MYSSPYVTQDPLADDRVEVNQPTLRSRAIGDLHTHEAIVVHETENHGTMGYTRGIIGMSQDSEFSAPPVVMERVEAFLRKPNDDDEEPPLSARELCVTLPLQTFYIIILFMDTVVTQRRQKRKCCRRSLNPLEPRDVNTERVSMCQSKASGTCYDYGLLTSVSRRHGATAIPDSS